MKNGRPASSRYPLLDPLSDIRHHRLHLTKNKQSPTGLGDPILFLMKQEDAQLDANWGGSPSPIHHWMEALLRLAAMCLLNLARLLGMSPSRHPGECHTDVSRRSRKAKAGATPQALPLKDRDPATKETIPAVRNSSEPTIALMLSSERSSRPSKHEGALTARRHESSLASCKGETRSVERFSRHRDAFTLSRLRAAAAHRHEESRNLPRPSRTRVSGHTAPT
jgi:hypothetical protein